MNILIVEDELLIAEMLKEMLLDLKHTILGIAKNFDTAEMLLENNEAIDFCFLDINLHSSKSGYDVANLINAKYKIPFVFLTSYSDKSTIEIALAYKPQAYLIKPFSEIDLFTTIELVKTRTSILPQQKAQETIVIKDGAKTIKIAIDEILWLKSENIYIEIKTTTKTHLVRNSLVQFLEEINVPCFKRVHRTFAVNINNVNAVTGQHLLVANEKIPLSRKFREQILSNFQ